MNLKEIKILKQDNRQKIILVADSDNKKYIEREMFSDKRGIYRTLKKINHPNIPKIYEIEFNDSTIVTEEYIEGKSLRTLMDENYRFTRHQINHIAIQLASALNTLHKETIIHRDIKPENIIMNESGHIWLIDYDISRFYCSELRKDTEIMGTFGYAPIEQFGMIPTDYKSDIYSFGATIIRLLDYAGVKGTLYKIADKCKRLDPSQRYENVSKLQKALKYQWLRNPVIYIVVIFIIISLSGITISNLISTSTNENDNVIPTASDTPQNEDIVSTSYDVSDTTEDERTFINFTESETEQKYSDSPTFSQVAIFSVDELWEHLLFIEDGRKTGEININDSKINADIELKDGVLSISLNDSYGHEFNNEFTYNTNNTYIPTYTDELRKNADIICWDVDSDGTDEMLIGINEGVFGVSGKQIYNYFNYCQGWCLKYDKKQGFILCDGDMFVIGGEFNLTKYNSKINIRNWDENNKFGYELKENKIEAF